MRRRALILSFLVLPMTVLAQISIPAGTALPAQLNSSLNSEKAKAGQKITARLMQDVPLSLGHKLPAGARVIGHVMSVKAAQNGQPGEITVDFEQVKFDHHSIGVKTSLRALASMMEVDSAHIPPDGPDRGTPWAWETRNLIGGEVAYGEGGPVVHGGDVVGKALFGGVLALAMANAKSGCPTEPESNRQPQALWVFASDACGVYGVDAQISHSGRTSPAGEIALSAGHGNLDVRAGSGLLLTVNGTIGDERLR
jgi:hypothetical protein